MTRKSAAETLADLAALMQPEDRAPGDERYRVEDAQYRARNALAEAALNGGDLEAAAAKVRETQAAYDAFMDSWVEEGGLVPDAIAALVNALYREVRVFRGVDK